MSDVENTSNDKPSGKDITKNPVIIFLAAVVGAFVAGVTAWLFLQSQNDKRIEEKLREFKAGLKAEGLIGRVSNQGEKGSPGLRGTPGVPGRDGKDLPIGSILASMLSPQDFLRIYGVGWIPADGREIETTSEYFRITAKKKIPDLRGMFLRGMNLDRTDGDPDRDRVVGDPQGDMIKTHAHPYTDRSPSGGSGAELASGRSYGRPIEEKLSGPVGGVETRPKNVAVYYYLKIN